MTVVKCDKHPARANAFKNRGLLVGRLHPPALSFVLMPRFSVFSCLSKFKAICRKTAMF